MDPPGQSDCGLVFVWVLFFFFLLDGFVLTDFVVGRERFLPVLEEDEEEDGVDVNAADFLEALDVAFVVVFDFDLAVALDVFVRFLPVLEEDEVDVDAADFFDALVVALVVAFVVVFALALAVALDIFVRFLPVLDEDEIDVVAADFLDALDVAFVVVFALALALDTIPTMPNPFVDCEDIFTLDSTPSSVKTTLILEYIVL